MVSLIFFMLHFTGLESLSILNSFHTLMHDKIKDVSRNIEKWKMALN